MSKLTLYRNLSDFELIREAQAKQDKDCLVPIGIALKERFEEIVGSKSELNNLRNEVSSLNRELHDIKEAFEIED